MQRDDDEDAAWRAIVDNYGTRPELDPETAPAPVPDPAQDLADLADLADPAVDDDWDTDPVFPDDRFVPPPPPPLPRPSRDRLIAWLGVFGAPAVLLVCLIAGIGLPRLLAYGLVAAFVGGFVYLVWRMPRGPRDPWDDGAKV
ncbi:MAG TPA: hypothetical protein VMF51_09125 [Nocardioides sp.]|uniref:hypothetical protein n=1 Tax=Nocardioides sp. TaxID=35761 RepID=UPI002CE00823|nr:hypothetical protein [Nocardioides sp.]HTW15280.1 hypothetical protein [Nocardioides sp.]